MAKPERSAEVRELAFSLARLKLSRFQDRALVL